MVKGGKALAQSGGPCLFKLMRCILPRSNIAAADAAAQDRVKLCIMCIKVALEFAMKSESAKAGDTTDSNLQATGSIWVRTTHFTDD